MGFYEDIRDSDVYPMLQEFGMAMTLSVTSAGTFNPVTGTTIGSVTTTYAGVGVITDYSTRDIDGTVIQQGDKKVLLALDNVDLIPATGDKLDTYIIQNVNSLAPAGINVLWTIQVRR